MYRYEDNHLKVAYSSIPPIPVSCGDSSNRARTGSGNPVLLGDFTLYPESSPCGRRLENNARGSGPNARFAGSAPLFPPKY